MVKYILIFLMLAAVGLAIEIDTLAELETAVTTAGDHTIKLNTDGGSGGVYTLDETLYITTNTTITADDTSDIIIDGGDTYLFSTLGNGTTQAIIGDADSAIEFKDLTYFYIRDGSGSLNATFTYCEFYGTDSQNGVRSYDTAWLGDCTLTFNNCKIYNNAKDGFSIETGAGGAGYETRAIFNDCDIYSNGGVSSQGDGLTAHGGNGDQTIRQYIITNRCNIYDNEKSGVYTIGGGSFFATDCTIYGNCDEIATAAQVQIDGNGMGDPNDAGISICSVINCNIYATNDAEVVSRPLLKVSASEAIVIGNTFDGKGYHTAVMLTVGSIDDDYMEAIVIKNNRFINSAQTSSQLIEITDDLETFGIFMNNWVSTGFTQLYLQSKNCVIRNNIFQNAGQYAINCVTSEAYSGSGMNGYNIFSNPTTGNINNDTGGIDSTDREYGSGPTVVSGGIVYGLESASTGGGSGATHKGLYGN